MKNVTDTPEIYVELLIAMYTVAAVKMQTCLPLLTCRSSFLH
jgi:hypothetical protein